MQPTKKLTFEEIFDNLDKLERASASERPEKLVLFYTDSRGNEWFFPLIVKSPSTVSFLYHSLLNYTTATSRARYALWLRTHMTEKPRFQKFWDAYLKARMEEFHILEKMNARFRGLTRGAVCNLDVNLWLP